MPTCPRPRSRGLFARAIIESGSCLTWSQSDADAAAGQVASAVGCPASADAAAIACLRAAPVQALLDAGNNWVGPLLVSQNRSLPQDPDAAVTSGAFARVPVLVGANRDEGRTFTQDAVDGTKAQYEQDLQNNFGPYAAAIEARYPWPSVADRWTMAYLIGAIITDGGFIGNIGGCANRTLTNRFASYTTTYSYQFDHRTGPGLTPLPGYVWGAGHAAELAYMWPSFNNGTPIAATFDAAERRLAHDMVAYWGAFIRSGSPDAADGTPWPRLRPSPADKGRLLSLRAGGHSTSITDGTLSVQHQCDFWATVFS